MAAVLEEVGKSEDKLQDDTQNGQGIDDLDVEDGASEASKKKKRKKKKKKAGDYYLNFSSLPSLLFEFQWSVVMHMHRHSWLLLSLL